MSFTQSSGFIMWTHYLRLSTVGGYTAVRPMHFDLFGKTTLNYYLFPEMSPLTNANLQFSY